MKTYQQTTNHATGYLPVLWTPSDEDDGSKRVRCSPGYRKDGSPAGYSGIRSMINAIMYNSWKRTTGENPAKNASYRYYSAMAKTVAEQATAVAPNGVTGRTYAAIVAAVYRVAGYRYDVKPSATAYEGIFDKVKDYDEQLADALTASIIEKLNPTAVGEIEA